jgi:dienelactone hydrolase
VLPDVITPFTTLEEWKSQRSRVREAFFESLGRFPDQLVHLAEDAAGSPVDAAYQSGSAAGAHSAPEGESAAGRPSPVQSEEISRTTEDGLARIEFRYQVVGDYWTDAVLLAPPDFDQPGAKARPVVPALHGTNKTQGKYSMVAADTGRNRSYALELARRGFIAVAPDQFGFGPDSRELGQDALIERFFADYPDWSLDGIRLASHMRLIDLLSSSQFLPGHHGRPNGGAEGAHPDGPPIQVGAIGNSLGGRAVIHLAAADDRVAAAVVSTGISPNYSNVYRHIKRPGQIKSPRLTEKLATDGIPPWDFQHLISLCAPRSILIVEPWFDPYNPDTPGAMSCAAKAAQVYRLVGRPEGLRLLVHGDGHDTTDATRDYAYGFLEEGLGQ